MKSFIACFVGLILFGACSTRVGRLPAEENSSFSKPCGLDPEMTIDERIEDCGTSTIVIKPVMVHLSNGRSITLIAQSQETMYFRDDSTNLLWGPIKHSVTRLRDSGSNSSSVFYFNESNDYCNDLGDLGLKWRLPTRKEILLAGGGDGDFSNLRPLEEFREIIREIRKVNIRHKSDAPTQIWLAPENGQHYSFRDMDGYSSHAQIYRQVPSDYLNSVACVTDVLR